MLHPSIHRITHWPVHISLRSIGISTEELCKFGVRFFVNEGQILEKNILWCSTRNSIALQEPFTSAELVWFGSPDHARKHIQVAAKTKVTVENTVLLMNELPLEFTPTILRQESSIVVSSETIAGPSLRLRVRTCSMRKSESSGCQSRSLTMTYYAILQDRAPQAGLESGAGPCRTVRRH